MIPFELVNGYKILIHAQINGKKVKLLVDNGKLWNEVWFYNGEVDSLNLHYKNADENQVVGLGEDGGSAIFDGTKVDIEFDNVLFNNQPTLISPPNSGFQDMFPGINGQVSSIFFKHFVVKFDFEKSVIVLYKPEKFKHTEVAERIEMDKRDNGSYCISFTFKIDDKLIENYMVDIDLGTVFPFHLFENRKRNIFLPAESRKHLIGYGASGKIYGCSGTIDEVILGRYSFKNVPAEFVEESKNNDIIESGTFGIPLMEKFHITFNYFNNELYLEPNKNYFLPFKSN